VCTTNTDINTA